MSNQNGTFQSSAAHTRWRYLKDRIARYSVAIGGLGVIAAVMLIFVYLFYTVIPLFLPAEVEDRPAIETTATQTETLFLATEEQAEIGVRLLRNGEIQFFGLKNGKDIAKQQLSLNQGEELVQVSILDKPKGIFAAISNQARLFVLQHFYKISYPDDVRLITPVIKYPYGEEAISLIEPPSLEPVENAEPSASIAESNLQPSGSVASQGLGMAQAITPKVMPTYEIKSLTVADGENRFVTALGFADGRTELFVFNKASGLFSDGATLEPQTVKVLDTSVKPDFLSIDQRLDWLYVASKTGDLAVFGMSGPDAPWLSQTLRLTDSGQKLTAMSL
ncbi:MAG: hypothetical protein R3352_06600, partial [Salinisphaeraceae bacterium]|nr:hypothetical protein [Salinisphaeraceae bacterium]